jgi:lactoylglutathione lyase
MSTTVTVAAPPKVRQTVPLLHTRDMTAAIKFYVDGLGFKVSQEWRPEGALRWCWLQNGDAALMLQTYILEGPHKNVPAERLGVGLSLCFICDDALAVYREAKAKGLAMSRPFVGNAMWVTGITDPDGYQLNFESLTDVPEGTEHAD